MKKIKTDSLAMITILLMCVTSLAGILSMDFTHKYEFINQYGHAVEMYGYGIYAHDTYFSAPISIGTDYCVLFVIVPMFLYIFWQYRKTRSKVTELKLISMYAITFYYAASIAFGITFNRLFLIYMILFTCSLFGMFYHIYHLKWDKCITYTKGIQKFLIISGIALYVAWFPDIVPSMLTGKTLPLIGVYTTMITYVLDMGIISPLCFVTLALLQKKKPLGTLLWAIMVRACIIVGIMMLPQTICQFASGFEVPLPALLTKSCSFVFLGIFACLFQNRMYRELGGSPFKQQFDQEMETFIQTIPATNEACSKEEIKSLPKSLQKYCEYIGLEGFPKYPVVNAFFKDTNFVFDDESGKIISMDYDLWLTNPIPYRKAYCGSSMYGIPFEGMDYMTEDKKGGMKGIFARVIPLFNVTSEQGYCAGIISWFIESIVLNPSVLFSEFVSYEEMDEQHLKVTISYQGISGTGILTLNEKGEITEFYSDERQTGKVDGEERLIGWRCECSNYEYIHSIRYPKEIKAIKVYPDKEIVYFDADQISVSYRNNFLK